MIINKIQIENFMCYSGNNIFEFTEGLNVVIGDTGYGKSKLYDAFYWVLYNQIFIVEKKEFQKTSFLKSKIISDKAKDERKEGRITASVTIYFYNSEKGNAYILERKYSINILSGKVIESNDSEFNIMKKELSYLNSILITDEEEKIRILNKILPPDIKDYLWFQGEQVESIIDFNKHDSLTKAINVLSSITRYDRLKEIAMSVARIVNSEYDSQVKRLTRDRDKFEILETSKRQIEDRISILVPEESDIRDNLSRAEINAEELLSKITDATKLAEINQKIFSNNQLLTSLNNSLSHEQKIFHRKMFRNRWVLKGTEKLQDEFSKKYSFYINEKLKRATDLKMTSELESRLQTRLPFDVPEPIYVQKMLEDQRCLVCDREAIVDSEAWNKIKELIERPSEKIKSKILSETRDKNDFSDDYKRLYNNGLSLVNRIPEIDQDIQETLQNIFNINSQRKNTQHEIENLENDKMKVDPSKTVLNPEAIVAEYSIKNKHVKDYSDKLNTITQQLDHYKKNLQSIKDQLKDLVTGEIPTSLSEKKQIANDFESIAISTRDRVFSELIVQLENEANKHYMAMTSDSKSVRGQIRLRKLPNGNYMPEITDNDQNPTFGYNQSNIILVKLATIMAIVSAKSTHGIVSYYSLITDAPFSTFGEDYTIGFCKTVSQVYKQSIIMSKEFYKNQNLRNELLNNPEIKIGKVYMITPSVLENERYDRKNLSTTIQMLN